MKYNGNFHFQPACLKMLLRVPFGMSPLGYLTVTKPLLLLCLN
jgi:hypothetical protein